MSLPTFLSSLMLSTWSIPITKNAYLTPSNEDSGNGATITRLGNGLDVDSSGSPQYWELDANDNQGFNLQLSLDDTWGFHPSNTTKLIISIESDDLYCNGNPSNCNVGQDIIVAFSQNGVSQYISVMIQLDLTGENLIYPGCDRTSPYTQSYEPGNIVSLIDAYNNNRDRLYKMKKGGNADDLSTVIAPVKFPLSFILENNPSSNYMLFSLINDGVMSSCGFIEMTTEIGLDIYFSSEDIGGVSFEMKALNVTHIYDPTTSDLYCDNGLIFDEITPYACCPASCGACGGPTCQHRPGGWENCCHSGVLAAGQYCDTNTAPCLLTWTEEPTTEPDKMPSLSPTNLPTMQPSEISSMTPSEIPAISPSIEPINMPTLSPKYTNISSTSPDPYCDHGLRYVELDAPVCCVLSCGTCGGLGCSARPGGGTKCCGSSIIIQNNSCDTNGAPCVITSVRYPTTNPSINPSVNPTINPTANPTINPTIKIILAIQPDDKPSNILPPL